MTTKEEVLQLCDQVAGDRNRIMYARGYIFSLEMLTSIIELAKAQGAAEERNKYNNFIERLRQIPMVEPASADTELNELVELFDAIRNRERKE